MKVAVIGAGVAGLSAAYRLRDSADITLYEEDSRLGGHAHSVEVADRGRTIGLDTAFIVFNEPHYPGLTGFFNELDVPYHDHVGRFSFHDLDSGTIYVSEDFDLDPDEVAGRYSPEFARLSAEAHRFLSESPRHFVRKQAEMPLGEYLDMHGYSDSFRHGFIVMLTTAAWSVPASLMWEMPAATVIAFFLGHGYEGLGGKTVPWHTVTGGSVTYVRAVTAALVEAGATIRRGVHVGGLLESADG